MGLRTTDRQLCNLCFPHLINVFSQNEHSTEDARNVAKGCDEDITQERHGTKDQGPKDQDTRTQGKAECRPEMQSRAYMAQERAKMLALPARGFDSSQAES
ncbi:hypothetical protein M5D96_013955 [Drosophila gunungcola]|uniref:Uncharacterized protein n=1 Tax=Drosophila gunungcola TaxID=103775 RepID=A0A9P9YAC5_9MUSC|nr:hypothetical protein M5D96_013955 [Drosophila gunungcola]